MYWVLTDPTIFTIFIQGYMWRQPDVICVQERRCYYNDQVLLHDKKKNEKGYVHYRIISETSNSFRNG